ncbi:MAG TPA: hypothetical protein VN776_03025 [Terracidiphilus sp.]|nr:hypothetical protein [Terracidiphilus sp.]
MKTDFPSGETVIWAEQGPLPVRAGLKRSLVRLGSLLRRARGGVLSKDESESDKAAQILELLARQKFFECLDDRLCPAESSQRRAWCQGGFEITVRILNEIGIYPEEIQQALKALAAMGSECDCGVLYNAAQQSRLKTEYWLARAVNGEPFDPHSQMHRS